MSGRGDSGVEGVDHVVGAEHGADLHLCIRESQGGCLRGGWTHSAVDSSWWDVDEMQGSEVGADIDMIICRHDQHCLYCYMVHRTIIRLLSV